MQIDFLGMQAFLGIVECGGFQQAAEHLHLSQTAVSHRIRKLEEQLGVRLLTRTTRQVTLTDAGRALLPGIRRAMQELAQSYDRARQYQSTAPHWLAVACLPTLAASRLSPALRTFARQHPAMAVRVFDDTVNDIAQHVAAGAAAFGISIASAPRPGLVARVFAQEPFVLVCATNHPLAQHATVNWADLTQDTLIRISLPAGNAATIDDALESRRHHFHWGYEVQHTALALDLVASGLGVTVVPALSVGRFPGVCARPLAAPTVSRSLTLVTRQHDTLSEPAQQLCQLILDELQRELGQSPDASPARSGTSAAP